MSADWLLLAALAGLMLTGAWLDLSQRRLPNSLCLLVLVAGIGATLWQYGPGALAMASVHALIVLLVGMFLFKLGMIGGGDVKFYAAVAFWFPLHDAFRLLLLVSVFGLVLLVVWFLIRLRAPKSAQPDHARKKIGLPYGIAIALGALTLGFINL